MSLRLPYGPKPDAPVRFTFGFIAVMFMLPAIVVLLFVVRPFDGFLVSVVALLVLAAVFAGVAAVLSRRSLSRAPERRPQSPR